MDTHRNNRQSTTNTPWSCETCIASAKVIPFICSLECMYRHFFFHIFGDGRMRRTWWLLFPFRPFLWKHRSFQRKSQGPNYDDLFGCAWGGGGMGAIRLELISKKKYVISVCLGGISTWNALWGGGELKEVKIDFPYETLVRGLKKWMDCEHKRVF